MEPISFLDGRVTLYPGNCLDVLLALPENSLDSVVTDPPYHLTSIVKRFGGDNAAEAKEGQTGAFKRASTGFMGRTWDGGDIAFRPDVWRECLRVLKPGGYLLAFASTRGFGRMSVAIEDAGFITHPFIGWIFGSGFPKATRIKAEGYDGFRYGGQALKPAIEPIYMGQKPFEKGLSGTENILKWGTGALNIDGCRVGTDGARNNGRKVDSDIYGKMGPMERVDYGKGRWPANLIHDGSAEVLAAFPDAPGAQREVNDTFRPKTGTAVYGDYGPRPTVEPRGDAGSAARFFYQAKADSNDRIGSRHPTVKPVDLMQYLVRLVTPPGGTVLDPFAGTGTTGEAAWREGMNAILIERELEYQDDIAERMRLCLSGPDERAREIIKRKGAEPSEPAPLLEWGGQT
ncbi:MAG: site-specific DNA-methyltransferase [Nitratireductor sp.]|nr:site-specific DNA-methyltransferase [Nitratireductor sp.]